MGPHPGPAMQTFLLVLEHGGLVPTPGPLHLLFRLPGRLLPQSWSWLDSTLFVSVSKTLPLGSFPLSRDHSLIWIQAPHIVGLDRSSLSKDTKHPLLAIFKAPYGNQLLPSSQTLELSLCSLPASPTEGASTQSPRVVTGYVLATHTIPCVTHHVCPALDLTAGAGEGRS